VNDNKLNKKVASYSGRVNAEEVAKRLEKNHQRGNRPIHVISGEKEVGDMVVKLAKQMGHNIPTDKFNDIMRNIKKNKEKPTLSMIKKEVEFYFS